MVIKQKKEWDYLVAKKKVEYWIRSGAMSRSIYYGNGARHEKKTQPTKKTQFVSEVVFVSRTEKWLFLYTTKKAITIKTL